MTRASGEGRRIWTAPIAIACATLVSLIGALVADGVWDWLASLLLGGAIVYAVGLGLRSYESR